MQPHGVPTGARSWSGKGQVAPSAFSGSIALPTPVNCEDEFVLREPLNTRPSVTAALGSEYSSRGTNGRARTGMWRADPSSGGAHPALLPGPKVWVPVLAPPQSSYVTAKRLLSLSLLICKMDGLDKWGASGAATGKRRTSGVLSGTGVKKKRALANHLGPQLVWASGRPPCAPELLDTAHGLSSGRAGPPSSAPCASVEPTPACRCTAPTQHPLPGLGRNLGQ